MGARNIFHPSLSPKIFQYAIQQSIRICQKLWVLAPTVSKSVGAEALTAPILTETLGFIDLKFPHMLV